MNLLTTIKGSNMENYIPKGWDLKRIDDCCSHQPEEVFERQSFWNKDFAPVICNDNFDFSVKMGHEIALTIKAAKDCGEKLILILPVGPMGMYQWVVYFLQEWKVDAKHCYCFNMDEWSDIDGNTLDSANTGSFQYAMEQALYEPLGELTVPADQRNFATRDNLPKYAEKIAALKTGGAKLVTVFGIGRCFHIAFWEPQFAGEYDCVEDWKSATHRLGAKLNPMTIEQNALHSFKTRTTLVPAFANTIGPGLFLQSDWIIGGSDGAYERGMMWSGMSLWVALRYSPDPWVPASFMPTMPGKLFFFKALAGPLEPECN